MKMLKYKVVIGDSRDMSEVEDGSVQLVVTSPPYVFLVVFSEKGEPGSERDLSQLNEESFFREIAVVWKECYRVLKPGGYLVCEFEDIPTGSWRYGYPNEICLCGPMVKSIEDSGLILISRWIWKKCESGVAMSKFQYTLYSHLTSSDPRAVANWGYCFVFKKRGGSRPGKLDFTREDWKVWNDGIWRIENPSVTGEGLAGGAVFPDELVRRFIKIYSVPGDTVLDPFFGTGTTMKVAFELDRNCIGYEALPKMLNVIRSKVKFGAQKIGDVVEWKEVIK